MKMKTLQLTVLILVLTIYSYPQSNSWNGIIPLKSTRNDVEKLLGKPPEDGGYLINGEFAFIKTLVKIIKAVNVWLARTLLLQYGFTYITN